MIILKDFVPFFIVVVVANIIIHMIVYSLDSMFYKIKFFNNLIGFIASALFFVFYYVIKFGAKDFDIITIVYFIITFFLFLGHYLMDDDKIEGWIVGEGYKANNLIMIYAFMIILYAGWYVGLYL